MMSPSLTTSSPENSLFNFTEPKTKTKARVVAGLDTLSGTKSRKPLEPRSEKPSLIALPKETPQEVLDAVEKIDSVEEQLASIRKEIEQVKIKSGYLELKEEQSQFKGELHDLLIEHSVASVKSEFRKNAYTIANTAPPDEEKAKRANNKRNKIKTELETLEELSEEQRIEIASLLVPS